MRTISAEQLALSLECARRVCPPEMMNYLDPDLGTSSAQKFYDGRIVAVLSNSGGVPALSRRELALTIEGPNCDRLIFVRFINAKELRIGSLDLLSLPDLLMLEFSDAPAGYRCTIHFTSCDDEIFFLFDSMEFSANPVAQTN